MMPRRKQRFKRILSYMLVALVSVWMGYILRDRGGDILNEIIRAVDHHYVVIKNFCTGTINYSLISQGHVVLFHDEIRQIYEDLEKARTFIHDKNTLLRISTHLDFLKNKLVKKYGDNFCPEMFVMTTVDRKPYSYFETNCKNRNNQKEDVYKSPRELMTLLFDLTEVECSNMVNKMKRIAQFEGLSVIFGMSVDIHQKCATKLPDDVNVVLNDKGNIWKKLIDEVETPYTFLGRDMDDFAEDSDLSDFNRLLRELRTGESVIGGSLKTSSDGHWYLNCYQIEHRNYTVSIEGGYHHSYHDCLFCDYFRGPIIAETKFLRTKLDFTTQDQDEMFLDLFLTISNENLSPMVCPDVMFYTDTSYLKSAAQETWLQLGKRFDFVSVTDELGEKFELSCDQLEPSFNANNKDLFVHPCILRSISEAVRLFMELCREKGVVCELTAGTLLGAVKFGRTLPWDYDGDINFHPENASLIDAHFTHVLQRHGFTLEAKVHNQGKTPYFNLYIDLKDGRTKLDIWPILKPMVHQKGPRTKAWTDGEWLEVPDNPARDARNSMGPEIFKHQTERGLCRFGVSPGAGREPSESDRPFPPCPRPNHHTCLDRYPTDGNIHFKNRN